jgi:hypothetical protein
VVGSIGVVLVLGIVVALGNGWLDSPAPPAQNFANLTVAPSPDPTSWQGIALDCTPLPYVNHHFPNEYKGHVYVQLAASTSAAVDATILIKWGGKGLLKHLAIRPGLVSKGLGGTLIQFNKNTNTIENPADANPQIAGRIKRAALRRLWHRGNATNARAHGLPPASWTGVETPRSATQPASRRIAIAGNQSNLTYSPQPNGHQTETHVGCGPKLIRPASASMHPHRLYA